MRNSPHFGRSSADGCGLCQVDVGTVIYLIVLIALIKGVIV
jgi:hypothetical protein